MYVKQGVQYPLTIEVYGGNQEGKLGGSANPKMDSWNATSASDHQEPKLYRQLRDAGAPQSLRGDRGSGSHRKLLRHQGSSSSKSLLSQFGQKQQPNAGTDQAAAVDTILKLVQGSTPDKQACFSTFNPTDPSEYREVISRWVVILLLALENAARPHEGA